jgi:hypothetical protein
MQKEAQVDAEMEGEKEGVHWMVFVLYSRRMKGIHETGPHPFSARDPTSLPVDLISRAYLICCKFKVEILNTAISSSNKA